MVCMLVTCTFQHVATKLLGHLYLLINLAYFKSLAEVTRSIRTLLISDPVHRKNMAHCVTDLTRKKNYQLVQSIIT
jgi:predicted HAD superfamily Cof-like phosphohydrolase